MIKKLTCANISSTRRSSSSKKASLRSFRYRFRWIYPRQNFWMHIAARSSAVALTFWNVFEPLFKLLSFSLVRLSRIYIITGRIKFKFGAILKIRLWNIMSSVEKAFRRCGWWFDELIIPLSESASKIICPLGFS